MSATSLSTVSMVASEVATQAVSTVKPVIRAEFNGATFEGVPGSYCWPQVGATPCSIVDDPQPAASLSVKPGDTLTFSVDPNTGTLDSFRATLLDDKTASGDPIESDLTVTQNVFTVDASLPNGSHRVEIDVVYPADANGSQNFVAYVFGLRVSSSTAATAMSSATAETAITEQASEAATVSLTAAITESATSSVTESATPNAPSVTMAATTILANTSVTTQPGITASVTPIGTSTVAVVSSNTPTATSTTAPRATTTNTATKTATVQPTLVPTLISPTSTPTMIPTVQPPISVTAESTTASTTAVALITTPDLSMSRLAPVMSITTGGKSYDPVAISALIQGSDGTQIAITRPVNANAAYIRASVGSDAQIAFSGPRPTLESVTLYNSDATKILGQQTISPDNLVLYTLPPHPGTYVLTVQVQWPSGKATYYFRAAIVG